MGSATCKHILPITGVDKEGEWPYVGGELENVKRSKDVHKLKGAEEHHAVVDGISYCESIRVETCRQRRGDRPLGLASVCVMSENEATRARALMRLPAETIIFIYVMVSKSTSLP